MSKLRAFPARRELSIPAQRPRQGRKLLDVRGDSLRIVVTTRTQAEGETWRGSNRRAAVESRIAELMHNLLVGRFRLKQFLPKPSSKPSNCCSTCSPRSKAPRSCRVSTEPADLRPNEGARGWILRTWPGARSGPAGLPDGDLRGMELLIGGEKLLPGIGAEIGLRGEKILNGDGRVCLAVESRPGDRQGDWGSLADARGVRRHGGGSALVAEVVEIDLSGS